MAVQCYGSPVKIAWCKEIQVSRYWISVSVSGTYILNFNRSRDSGFFELYSGRDQTQKINKITKLLAKVCDLRKNLLLLIHPKFIENTIM